ncbi:1-aminocyclopropane-1-carboxylate deaminase/D-cysteine desulfhydrase [Aquirufa rosea]|uniref:Pyridoxal-phosphate dependent enzyme n=1 Tax=Aquirufa rosea TaxID=2509241 RepID=A0A4Q1C211_9BACT|nr:pyridoxal-phosphate dependent enzyme [Aquirufa rosea]RXK52213.1 pyridoxal-phosphate dependent enzyme [Aquirufa rosea]
MDIATFENSFLNLPSPLEEIYGPLWQDQQIRLFLKRDDLIHQTVSGNKWRKLKEYIQIAQDNPKKGIISFGGAYSNHLYALAYVCHQLKIPSIGIVRGDELNESSNPYLKQIHQWGMKLHFLDRKAYQKKEVHSIDNMNDYWVIPEGGYSNFGISGIREIVLEIENKISSDYIISAVGTGTTVIGLAKYSSSNIVGILCLNNKIEIQNHLQDLSLDLPNLILKEDYVQGKYAKSNPALDAFCENFKAQHQIAIEPTYTGKMMLGVYDLLKKKYFPTGSTLICIHTGGVK